MQKHSVKPNNNIPTSTDSFLGGKLNVLQPKNGFRSGTDAVFLASFVNAKHGQKIAEFGSGVGVVSLAIATRVSNINITAFELNKDIANIAKQNVILNKLENSITVYNKDIQNISNEFANSFNILVSNPPFYKQESAKKAENNLRAQGFIEETATLEDFVKKARFCLKEKGYIYVIYTSERFDELTFLLKKYGFGEINILPIYSFNNSNANRVIVKARKNSKGYCKVLSPFIVHDGNGFSKQATDILNNGKQLIVS